MRESSSHGSFKSFCLTASSFARAVRTNLSFFLGQNLGQYSQRMFATSSETDLKAGIFANAFTIIGDLETHSSAKAGAFVHSSLLV